MKRKLLIAFLFLICESWVNAQYVNTDSLIITPEFSNPVKLNQYNFIEKQERLNTPGLFSQFLVPGNNGYIISTFGPRSGRMHYGTDIKMDKGDTVFAVFDGHISRAGYGYGFGNLIVVQHKNNISTYYAHLSMFLVNSGSWVNRGEPIGLAGSTGRARGNHLHFEMRENNDPFDPELVYDFKKAEVREDALEEESLMAIHRKLKPKGYANNIPVPEYYKVRSGDSLWAISRRFKTSITTICQLNRLNENSILQIGQPLKMY